MDQFLKRLLFSELNPTDIQKTVTTGIWPVFRNQFQVSSMITQICHLYINRVLTVEVCAQVDASDDRVSARIQQQFMGANPRAAVGADMPFDRLNTFKQSDTVRTPFGPKNW